MPSQPGLLQNLRVAAPCGQAWDAMDGDDRCRFCHTCGKNVYNLSAMTTAEAETFVREREGDACVRFYRRRDGTLLTANCPVGFRNMRRSFLFQCTGLTALFALIPGVGAAVKAAAWKDWSLWDQEPFYSVALRLGIRAPIYMGLMTLPTDPTVPPQSE